MHYWSIVTAKSSGEVRKETEGPKKAGHIMSHHRSDCGVGLVQGGQAEPKQGGFVTGEPWRTSNIPAWGTVWAFVKQPGGSQ